MTATAKLKPYPGELTITLSFDPDPEGEDGEVLQKRVRVTEQLFEYSTLPPVDMAVMIFRDAFLDVWNRRAKEKK